MKKCPSCSSAVSPKAETCPNCGHPIKKKTSGCAWLVLVGAIILLILIAIGSTVDTSETTTTGSTASMKAPNTATAQIHQEGDTVDIGYTTYVAWQSYWTDSLSDNQFMQEAPDAKYLVIEVSVRNDDTKERSIPPFKLIDTKGREYNTSPSAYILPDYIGALSSLNPDVQKAGYIAFDCPPDRDYKLQVSGGYWSGEHALIELNPSQ